MNPSTLMRISNINTMIVQLFQVITIIHYVKVSLIITMHSVKVSLFTFMTKQDKARHDMTIQSKQAKDNNQASL